ncbi:MAG: methyltransferase [Flavobacteriales bacterium]|nr:methyltransferase [Flavobacteriales bacterium]
MRSRGNKDLFVFKQFQIDQRDCGMRISEDGILLGAWADFSQCTHVLDLGCGTGLLSLMLAQRFPKLRITAIDIDPGAANRARENAENSAFRERIQVICADFFSLDDELLSGIDGIICNPPFFTEGKSSENQARSLARHELRFSLAQLSEVLKAFENIQELRMILPLNRKTDHIEAHFPYGQEIAVRSNQEKLAHRKLLSFSRKSMLNATKELVVRNGKSYSEAFKSLCAAFYLDL